MNQECQPCVDWLPVPKERESPWPCLLCPNQATERQDSCSAAPESWVEVRLPKDLLVDVPLQLRLSQPVLDVRVQDSHEGKHSS